MQGTAVKLNRECDQCPGLLMEGAATQPTATPTTEMPGGGVHMVPCVGWALSASVARRLRDTHVNRSPGV